MEKNRRTIFICFRLTQAEAQDLKRLAERFGLGRSALLRRLIDQALENHNMEVQ